MTDKEKLTLLRDQIYRINDLPMCMIDDYLQQVGLNMWPEEINEVIKEAVKRKINDLPEAINIENAMVVQEELSEVS